MSIEITASLIALLGIAFSAGIAYFTSIRQSKIESEKLRQEILQDFSVKLFERRLETYPALYTLLSKFIKRIQANGITKLSLENLLSEIDEWDSTYSIFFSAQTGRPSYRLRMFIAELIQLTDKELKKKFSSQEAKHDIVHRFQELELALKSELGVFAFEGPNKIGEFKKFQKYSETPKRKY